MRRFVGLVLVLTACGAPPCKDAGDCESDDSDAETLDTDVANTDTDPMFDTDEACDAGMDEDRDQDGWSIALGDCDDCDAEVSPSAIDLPSNGVDDDCWGAADAPPTPCDAALAIGTTDAEQAAQAIGLCADGSTGGWGLYNAQWITPDGMALSYMPGGDIGHGVLASFGAELVPLEGQSLLVLSTGTARGASDPGYVDPLGGYDKGYQTPGPAGYPVESAVCPGVLPGSPHDGVGLRLRFRTPSNAHTLRVDLAWFTASFGPYACSAFADFGLVTVEPKLSGARSGGNVAFDVNLDPFSAATPLLTACLPYSEGALSFECPLGTDLLAGTGYAPAVDATSSSGAGTGWLTLAVPIAAPGSEMNLRFLVWDGGDAMQDSALVIDNLRFDADTVELGPVTPR